MVVRDGSQLYMRGYMEYNGTETNPGFTISGQKNRYQCFCLRNSDMKDRFKNREDFGLGCQSIAAEYHRRNAEALIHSLVIKQRDTEA